MARTLIARAPSDYRDLHTTLASVGDDEVHLTLRLYAPLEDTAFDAQDENLWPRFLEPLYDDWAKAIRDVHPSESTPPPTWRFSFDITRPSTQDPAASNFEGYESRGLMRISALLRSKFREQGALEATVVGAPCWCFLDRTEKHIALPKGQSWPRSRASHVKHAHSLDKTARTCLRLAREHWDDEYWALDQTRGHEGETQQASHV